MNVLENVKTKKAITVGKYSVYIVMGYLGPTIWKFYKRIFF